MANERTHAQKTSAGDKSIGFDYQYYYFMYRMISLKHNETVGLEVKDDVHTELACDKQVLIQLKHTNRQSAGGSKVNLTTMDIDLWHTLSNWAKVISDPVDFRSDESKQILFIAKTDFLLVTNKSGSGKNQINDILSDPSNARSGLEKIMSETLDLDVIRCIIHLLSLDDEVLVLFVRHVVIETSVDDIIGKCKEALVEKQLTWPQAEEVFRSIDSDLRSANYHLFEMGGKVVISFDEYVRRYRRYFELARNAELVISRQYVPLPADLIGQVFVKQLVDIGDIGLDELDRVAIYTRYKIIVQNNLERWHQDGVLTGEELLQFKKDAVLRWDNASRSKFRRASGMDPKMVALDLLDLMRSERLSVSSQVMDTEFSNGEYYLLSDIPEIGWLQDWEKRYL